MSEAKETLRAAHHAQYGDGPQVTAWAPGRVNLLGEHTDYNGGYVLPIALSDLGVAVALSKGSTPGTVELYSATLKATDSRRATDPAAGRWSDYVLGCIAAVAADQAADTGLKVSLATTLPLGAGLSSSAALEVATLRALNEAFVLGLSAVDIAVTARAVENDYVGVPCGIMDQFASSVGSAGTALFLNTRTLEHASAPSLPGHSFVVIGSGVSHQLTDGGYATRVAECEAAAAALGVTLLSDLGPPDLPRIDAIPDPLNRRARHVVTDNRLVEDGLAALQKGDAATFGRLMIESHATERDNYEITVPETDALADAAIKAGALGARQTGGGWGGSVVALCPDDKLEALRSMVAANFPKASVLAVT